MTETKRVVPKQGFVLGNKLYDKLKFVTQVVLPAAGVLYLTLAGLWDLPHAQQVAGTCAGVALFLGTLLHLSSSKYSAADSEGTPVGSFVMSVNKDGKTIYSLDLHQDPATFADQDVISFKADRGKNLP